LVSFEQLKDAVIHGTASDIEFTTLEALKVFSLCHDLYIKIRILKKRELNDKNDDYKLQVVPMISLTFLFYFFAPISIPSMSNDV
jgi:hypothetical protein